MGVGVYWLWQETCIQEVVGLNPSTEYCKNCNVCLKRPKMNERGQDGPFKKLVNGDILFDQRYFYSDGWF